MKKRQIIGFHYGYVIVACCFLIMFVIVGLVMSCAGIFYKPISNELGVSVGKFGFYMSLNFLCSTLTLSFAGKLMERYSTRKILTICAAVIALAFIAMSRFFALWQFYIAGVIFGITLAFLLYLGFPTLINRWFKTRMGLFLGICSAGSGIGGVLFNPLAGYLITEYGWRTTYMLFGFFILIVIVPILACLLRDYPQDKGIEAFGTSKKITFEGEDCDGIEYTNAIKMPIFYGVVVFAFLINATATLNIFVPTYMQEIHYSVEQASIVASAVMTGVTIGKVALGMINDRSTYVGLTTTILCGIAGLGMLLMGQLGLLALVIGGFLFGWAYAGVTVQTPILVRSVFGSKNYTAIYSNISMAIAIGGAIAAGGWGMLADAISYRHILMIGIILLVVCGIIGIYSLRYKTKI